MLKIYKLKMRHHTLLVFDGPAQRQTKDRRMVVAVVVVVVGHLHELVVQGGRRRLCLVGALSFFKCIYIYIPSTQSTRAISLEQYTVYTVY